mgnify:CR=1 FL=1
MSTPFPIAAAPDASSLLNGEANSEKDREAARVPNTSMLPGTENISAASGCRDAPADRHGQTHAMADRMCAMRDQWVASTRSNVRYSPLTSLAAAALLGAVIARIIRR